MFFTLLLLLASSVANAAYTPFVSGSTGADGAFNPTTNTVVALPASGVLNYTTVNIPSNVTVTFTPNALNTPVTMLATGNVTISGTINVNGSWATSSGPGVGGPGGFNGGYSNTMYTVVGGAGLGPGGGPGGGTTTTPQYIGINGSYAGVGTNNAPSSIYGNVNLLPLIGGSGGGGGYNGFYQSHGGGGGGAIVIASSTTITHNGNITAYGGGGYSNGGAGSAGAIRLVANTITGTGSINASSTSGGTGRIYLQSNNFSYYGASNPMFNYGIPSSVTGSAPPTITITSVGGTNTPATPTGSYANADITLPNTTTNPVPVNISATNIPVGTVFSVYVIPQMWTSKNISTDLPPVSTTLSGTTASSSGTANVTIPTTCTTIGLACTSVISVQATFTVTALNYNGEEIDKVRVATNPGGGSDVFYITKTGKEIKVS